jgi:hypothetical protein
MQKWSQNGFYPVMLRCQEPQKPMSRGKGKRSGWTENFLLLYRFPGGCQRGIRKKPEKCLPWPKEAAGLGRRDEKTENGTMEPMDRT